MEADGDDDSVHVVKAVEADHSTVQGTSDRTDVIAGPLEAIEIEFQEVVGEGDSIDSEAFSTGVSVVASAIETIFTVEGGAVGEEQGAARLVACVEFVTRAAAVGHRVRIGAALVERSAVEVEIAEGFIGSSAIDVATDGLESTIHANLGFVLVEVAIVGAIAANRIAVAAGAVSLANGAFRAGSLVANADASALAVGLTHGGLTRAQTINAQTAVFAD